MCFGGGGGGNVEGLGICNFTLFMKKKKGNRLGTLVGLCLL
jgi:hypothetical protein